MSVQILVGDAITRLRELPDESVHCVVTSPPYWGLRAYKGEPGMIGLEPKFEEHLENLVAVFREVRRVLRKDGTLWLNYGDAYADGRTGLRANEPAGPKQRTSAGTMDIAHRPVPPSLKPKDLMMMPARVAMALQTCGSEDSKSMEVIDRVRYELIDAYRESGASIPDKVLVILERLNSEYSEAKGDSWWVRSEVIWHKKNPMPESAKDRPTNSHEKLFLLSKSPRYFYDAEAVKEPVTGNAHARRSYKTPDSLDTSTGNCGHRSFHKDGREKGHVRPPGVGVKATKPGSGIKQNESFQAAVVDLVLSRNRRNVWSISTEPYKDAHFATFPRALIDPCIKAGTSEKGCCSECGAPWGRAVEKQTTSKHLGSDTLEGNTRNSYGGQKEWDNYKPPTTTGWAPTCDHSRDLVPCRVLDPFSGAGTVGLMAQWLGRDAVLIEISPEYAEMSRNRIEADQPMFAKVEVT